MTDPTPLTDDCSEHDLRAEWDAQLRYVIDVRDERAPSDIDIEAGTNDASWWLQLREAIDGLDDIWRRAIPADGTTGADRG